MSDLAGENPFPPFSFRHREGATQKTGGRDAAPPGARGRPAGPYQRAALRAPFIPRRIHQAPSGVSSWFSETLLVHYRSLGTATRTEIKDESWHNNTIQCIPTIAESLIPQRKIFPYINLTGNEPKNERIKREGKCHSLNTHSAPKIILETGCVSHNATPTTTQISHSPFHRWENWAPERLINSWKVTRLEVAKQRSQSGDSEAKAQGLCTKPHCFLPRQGRVCAQKVRRG